MAQQSSKDANLDFVDTSRSIRDRRRADDGGTGGGGNDIVCLGIAAVGWAFGLLSHHRANKASSDAQRAKANAQNFKEEAIRAKSQLKAGLDERLKLKEYGEELARKLETAKKELAELAESSAELQGLDTAQKLRKAEADVEEIQATKDFMDKLNRLADRYLQTPYGSGVPTFKDSALTERTMGNGLMLATPTAPPALHMVQALLERLPGSPKSGQTNFTMDKTARHVYQQIEEASRNPEIAGRKPTHAKRGTTETASPRSGDENRI